MVTPRIVPRAEHSVSRREIDPDALKVLNRLRQFNHVAYLVGGSVRDLLLGRRPKDFDIGTSAHPYEVKRIFRNCWIVGRRFRLAHVKFGAKTIEVATFRRQVTESELAASDARAGDSDTAEPDDSAGNVAAAEEDAAQRLHETDGRTGGRDHLIHRDNTFGTPEEDAFRRDFTVNALFYDIATFSVIDYVGGLEDLDARVIRSIGDPLIRFQEDPVRMLRAIVLAARLDFTVDSPVVDAIRRLAPEIQRASPARLLDEFFKIMRSGASERAFRELADVGLLQSIAPELVASDRGVLHEFLASVDAYRHRFTSAPDTLTNPVLLGSLLVPLGFSAVRPRPERRMRHEPASGPESGAGETGGPGDRRRPPKEPLINLGMLPLPRKDVERLRQVLGLQRRLREMGSSPRAKRALMHRSSFGEALTWLELHGKAPEVLEHWRGFIEATGAVVPVPEDEVAAAPGFRRRRRRRGRRGRRRPIEP